MFGYGSSGEVPAPNRQIAMTLRSNIESVADGVLTGWYFASDGSREFRVFADGALLGAGIADRLRSDLVAAGIGDGAHGFAFALPPRICDDAEHLFAIAHRNDDVEVSAHSLRAPRCALRADGRLERLVEGEARGWVWDPRDPAARLQVFALAADDVVGATTADLPRDDLAQAGIGDGRHAFALKLPPGLARRAEPVELTFRVGDARDGAVLATVRLPVRPSRNAELAAVPFCELTAEARAGLREISDLLFLQGSADADVAVGAAGVTVAARGDFRLLHRFPAIGALLTYDWAIEIEFAIDVRAKFAFVIVDCAPGGDFGRMFALAADLALAPGRHRLAFSLPARRARAHSPNIFERPIFLSIEPDSPLDLRDLAVRIKLREAAQESVPLLAAEHPHFAQLADLNETLSSAGKRDPAAWALEAAEASLRLECFETASALIERVDVAGRADRFKLRYLRAFADVAFAMDRVDAVRAALREHWPLVEKDDWLFSAFSACFPPTAEMRSFFATLPSGRANRFWLARHRLSSEALAACLRDAFEDGQSDLLWASLARELGGPEYCAAWSRYLRRFQLEGLQSIQLSHRNVLSTVTFEPGPQTDDGPLVSVIMAACNASETVLYAIQSILQQSHTNFELLVCDDLSSDDTAAKLRLLQGHPRVRLFQSRARQGPYNIRNNLLREARGEFVTFQDADDVAHPARLARQLAELNRTGFPFTVARWVRVRPDGEVVFFRDQQCLRLSLVSLFAAKGAIERFGGFRPTLCGGDSEFAQRFRAPGLERLYSEMDEPLILGLWSAQSLTRQPGLESTENGVRSLARRVYAEAAARRTLLGDELVPDACVDEANRSVGIYRRDCGIAPLSEGGSVFG